MAKKNIRNYPRLVLQYGILVLLAYMLIRPLFDKEYFAEVEAYCPFGGLQSLASYITSNSLACSMTTVQVALGIALLIGVVLFSKLFCSFICPIGSVTEWLGLQGRRMKMQITLKGNTDKILRLLKYALLFITFYFTVTSSELFCKKYDPYYALMMGFDGDVYIWYAIPALLATLVGSFFIRQAWCKYLCPLGAVTNLAVYALPVSSLILLWVLLTTVVGLNIPWPWLLGAVCFTGFILEATTLKFLIFPSLRITRNDSLCTHCKICDKKCPMAVPISSVDSVSHIDCHLCTDCVVKCPEKGALTINKRNLRWVPFAAVVILIVAGIVYGNKYELPTISERWKTIPENNTGILEMKGLKNIKCFGSSRSFANHMKEIPGVIGVETYVKHKRATIYFDKTQITISEVKKAIFSPLTELINYSGKEKAIKYVNMGVDRCFDPNDQQYLAELLKKEKGVLGLITHFGEPVEATVYFDSLLTNIDRIKAAITRNTLETGSGDDKVIVETAFKVNAKSFVTGTIKPGNFEQLFFEPVDASFNGYEKVSNDNLFIYEIDFPQASQPSVLKWIPYLISHASNEKGIVRLQTEYTASGPVLKLWFVNTLITPEKIKTVLTSPEFLVHYESKPDEKVKNPFVFTFSE